MMSRPGAKHLLDFSTLMARPSRTLGWFLLGNSILAFWRVNYAAKMQRYNKEKYNLHTRVAQNEETHSILKTMKFHLGSRKMDIFEMMPR